MAGSSGTSFAPSSIMSRISHGSMANWSGSVTRSSVVPTTATVWMGTMMSPSAGILQRFTTVFTTRWLIATIVPFPASTWTSSPTVPAIFPAQAPEALTTRSAAISTSSPDTRS